MKNSGGKWKKITKYLLVILVACAAIFGLTRSKSIMTQIKNFFAAGQVPAHTKTISDNGNGTHKLSLDVVGDTDVDKKTANVNVLVIMDTSSSMENNDAGSGPQPPHRGDAAEKVMYDFATDLFGYQDKTNPSNIQMALATFDSYETTGVVQNWTSTMEDITGKLSSTGARNSRKLDYHSGTNWEAGLRTGINDVLSRADHDPTFVIFVTDGAPYRRMNQQGTGQVYTDMLAGYQAARDEARTIATYKTGVDPKGNVTFYGIYAYGNEGDYLDDLVYYALNGNERSIVNAQTQSTDNYFNASDTASLTTAISSIFEDIVTALGVADVKISDGTTQNVKTSSGDIAHLLNVDSSSFEYWLNIPLTRDGSNYYFTDNNANKINVSLNGTVATLTWTDSKGTAHTATYQDASITNLKLKVKWNEKTDFYPAAPGAEVKASGETSSVDWDLSSLKALLNGVTYTVTFDVYPSQETYDLIADLKNGTITYNDLDSEIQKYIVDNGDGSYSLRTNTQATLSYDDTRDEAGVQTKTYDNPDPVGTNVDTIAVQKILDNDIDGRTYGKINLELTRDGKKAFDVELDGTVDEPLAANPAPGSEVEPWKASGIYIATGLAKTVNGNLVVLDAGHDYTFGELGSELFNWELESITVHPMLIDGVLTELTLVEDSTTCPSGETCYTINDKLYKVSGTNPIITATNHRRSNLNIKKIVTGENANPNDEFEFTIKVTQMNEKNEIIKDNTTTNDDDLWFSVQDKDGNWIDYGENIGVWTRYVGTDRQTRKTTYYYYAPNNTELKINLKNNYNIRFTNLVSNTDVSVVESDKTNYELTDITATGFSSTEGGKDGYSTSGNTITGNIGKNNTSYQIEYTNNNTNPETISVPVKKVWEDNNDQDGIRNNETITFNLYGIDQNTPVDSYTFKTTDCEGNNCNYTFTNLPKYGNGEEINYTIKETGNTNAYTPSEITKEGNTLVITNTHTPEPTTIPVKKVWNDNNDQDGLRDKGSVTFNLYGVDKTTPINSHTFDLSSEECSDNECSYTFTKDNKEAELPKYEPGKVGVEINYSVEEVYDSDYYTASNPTKDENGNIVITNSHTPFETKISVLKIWNDDDNRDNARKPIKVVLTAGQLPDLYNTITLSESNHWTDSWLHLQKFMGGNPIEYTVTELTKLEGYTSDGVVKITPDETDLYQDNVVEYTITNNRIYDTVKIPVKKVWEDANNQDGIRDNTKVTFELYGADKETPVATHTFSDENCTGNICEYEFTTDKDGADLPKYEHGKVGVEINYTIKETSTPDGYTSTGPTEDDPYTITNTHEPETTKVPVKKVWNDANDQDGIRDNETITFNLYGVDKDTPVNTYTFETNKCANNECTYEFTTDKDGEDLPKYEPGKVKQKIEYTIEETGNSNNYTSSKSTEEDGTLVITNTHNPEPTTVPVKKVWEDANNQDGIRKNVTFELYGAAGAKVAEYTFEDKDCSGNECTYEFTKDSKGQALPKYQPGESGQEIEYTIKETGKPDGYEASKVNKDGNTLVITNVHVPEKVNVPVIKQWVDDNNSQDTRPNSIEVQLYADGKPVDGKTATITPKTDEQGNEVWEYEFKDLEKYEAGQVGHQINYTVKETVVPTGYTVTYEDGTIDDGTTIINTANETIKKKIPVEKVWDDLTNIEGIRPDSVTFKLVGRVGNDEVVDPYTTTIYKSEDDTNNTARGWIGEFKDVQVFYNGKLINYTLEEVTMDKSGDRYSVDIQGNDKDGYVVTNTSRPETIDFTATKNWNDNDDNDGKRPTEITVQLMNDNTGEKVGDEVVLKAEDWSYTWEDLDQFEPGKQGVKIKYSIVEVSEVEGYTPGDYDYETNSITNSHDPITISYKVKKIWDDFDNQDGKRPKSITVRLVGKVNGEVVVPEKVQKIDSSNDWTYEFKKLPKYYKKQLIQYTITEDVVDLYETKQITQVDNTEETKELANSITNKHELIPYDNTGKITVKKIWKDRDNKFHTRPSSITIHLFADGVEIDKAILNASNNWTYTFTGLNKYKEGAVGVEVVYTITEDSVKGYNSSIDGFVVTNTMNPPTEIVPPKTGVESNTDSNNSLFYIVAIILTTLGATTITFKYER